MEFAPSPIFFKSLAINRNNHIKSPPLVVFVPNLYRYFDNILFFNQLHFLHLEVATLI